MTFQVFDLDVTENAFGNTPLSSLGNRSIFGIQGGNHDFNVFPHCTRLFFADFVITN